MQLQHIISEYMSGLCLFHYAKNIRELDSENPHHHIILMAMQDDIDAMKNDFPGCIIADKDFNIIETIPHKEEPIKPKTHENTNPPQLSIW